MRTPTLQDIKASLDELATTAPGNLQKVMADQIKLLIVYYEEVIGQSKKSFRSAMIVAIVGFLFFIGAVVFLLIAHLDEAAVISLISGALTEVVSGINFYLYKQASNQLSEFHSRLDQSVRFMLANSIAEGMGALKDQTLAELVKLIAEQKDSG